VARSTSTDSDRQARPRIGRGGEGGEKHGRCCALLRTDRRMGIRSERIGSRDTVDMSITKRSDHPQEQTIRAAVDRAQVASSRHTSGHTVENADLKNAPVLTLTIRIAVG